MGKPACLAAACAVAVAGTAAVTTATTSPARADSADWLDPLYDRVAADLADGEPLVVEVHVPLCSNELIWCGNPRLGDGDSPATNLYWSTSGGFRGWFNRKGSGWKRVHRDDGDGGDILEVIVWRKRVQPTRAWTRRGVDRAFDVYVVAHAWRGTAMPRAIDAYVGDLYGSTARDIPIDDDTTIRAGGAAHVVGFVGHNGWMDIPPYDWDAAEKRGDADSHKGTIAIACMTADYLADDVPDPHRVPLIMTTGLMFAGAHGFEGAVSAFARGESLAGIRTAAARNHAEGQGKTVRAVRGLFTNPSDARWRSR